MWTEAPKCNDGWPPPEDGEGDEPTRLIESQEPDDTGIGVYVPADSVRRTNQHERVRVGGIYVPCGAFSFGIALAIHAVLLAGVLLASRWCFQAPRLPSDWGGGGEVSLADATARAVLKPGLPGDGSLPPVPPTRLPESARGPGQDASSFSATRATRLALDPAGDGTDLGPPISLSPGVGSERPPIFRHSARAVGAGNPSPAPPGNPANSATRTASVAPRAGRGVTSHAALPGALRGTGIPAPDYPPEARRRGEQGVVKVAVEVLPDGSLGKIRVVSDPGYPLLRNAALAATQRLRQFPFTPAYRFGQPVRDVVIIPYHFILQ